MSIFEIKKKTPKYPYARTGILRTPHGDVETPMFLPIGTRGSVKGVTAEELKFWGAQIVLANTYHLWQRPSDLLIRKAGGLHKFMGWKGPILTDSGGFQVFSLGRRHWDEPIETEEQVNYPRVLSIGDDGVKFRSELDGSEHFLSPEVSMQIQRNLGSDIALVLDEFATYNAPREDFEAAEQRTYEWAQRCIDEFIRLQKVATNSGQILYGIVQGGPFDDLRAKSARNIRSLDFPGYAIGGVAVSEEPDDVIYAAVEQVTPLLEEEKPRHLLGVGNPEQIVRASALGVDTFDCVLPTRNARHGELYVNVKPQEGYGYTRLRITNAQYAEDFEPVDNTCGCYGCQNYSRAYLRHLFMAKEPLALRLATMHNLRFYLDLMAKIRRAITYDSLEKMVEEYKER